MGRVVALGCAGGFIVMSGFLVACRYEASGGPHAIGRPVSLSSSTATSGATSASAPRHTVSVSELCVTEGRRGAFASQAAGGLFVVNTGALRASVAGVTAPAAELSFRDNGPSFEAAAGGGERARQVGLKLRGQDACNSVYVMWQLAPVPGVVVSVKSNPGAHAADDCGSNGELHVTATKLGHVPAVARSDEQHLLRAELVGLDLHVTADGEDAWSGQLPDVARTFDGPIGVRADNASLAFSLTVPDAHADQPGSGESCDPAYRARLW